MRGTCTKFLAVSAQCVNLSLKTLHAVRYARLSPSFTASYTQTKQAAVNSAADRNQPPDAATDVRTNKLMTDQLSGAASVLIVEDEILVRMFAVDALEDVGFQVLQAGDATEAMTALVGKPDVAAVIVDMGLPDRSGDQLAAEMRAQLDTLPILIASGRSERELKDKFAADPRIGVLVKPYTAAMLIGALDALGVPAPSPQA